MGRSAKVHKRVKKNSNGSNTAERATKAPAALAANESAKKAAVKQKIKGRGGIDGHVLGEADYVTIAMGGRRRAREEAKKATDGRGLGHGVVASSHGSRTDL